MCSSDLKVAMAAIRGPRTEGPMAPDISLDNQRPAEYVFSDHVKQAMEKLRHAPKVTTSVATAGSDDGTLAESAE